MGVPASITKKLQQAIVAISRQGAGASAVRDMRSVLLGAARMSGNTARMRQTVDQMLRIEAAKAAENANWIPAHEIADGKPGRFDATDLQSWLAIAKRANVPFIEAREILALEYNELEALLGTIDLSATPRTARAMAAIAEGLARAFSGTINVEIREKPEIDVEAVLERCFAAMDDIPEGWMVRTHVCGSNDLKALAGCGVTENRAPEVRFGSSLEVGPGWIRQGNRRRVNFEDERILKLYMNDDSRPLTFLARPWVPSSRYLEARDPHRAGTPLDIPGEWPAEWRAFVQKGRVTGVSFYYPHAGRADPVSADMALKVRELAQLIVDRAVANQQQPRMSEAAMLKESETHAGALSALGMGDDDFGCTLDFIETANGLMFLEGGPACTPFGGGHPCAFFSERDEINVGTTSYPVIKLEGVAFRHSDVLSLNSGPQAADRDVRSWDDVEMLANALPSRSPYFTGRPAE